VVPHSFILAPRMALWDVGVAPGGWFWLTQGGDKVRRRFQQKVVDTVQKETEPGSVLKRLFE
jgi:hypothetical protein